MAKRKVKSDVRLVKPPLSHIKSDFVTVASHQLRTPISAIRWTLDSLLMERNGKLNQKQKELIEQAYQSNNFMVKVVRDLLRVSRIEDKGVELHFQRVNLHRLIDEIIDEAKSYISAFNTQVSIDIDDKIKSIHSDPQQLKIVISSLLDNAVMYSRREGKIEIKVTRQKGIITLSLKDNGIGILSGEQNLVFDKFFRGSNAIKAQANGLGLNLHIAELITKAMHGQIWFVSKENIGTTFYISLPTMARQGSHRHTEDKDTHRIDSAKTEIKNFHRFLNEGLILVNRDGKIILINPLVERFFAVKAPQTIGQSLDQMIDNDEIKNIIKRGQDKTYKLDIKNKKDTFKVIIFPVKSHKRINGWMLLIQSTANINLPPEPKAELKKEREFVAITLHELKAPLGMSKWGLEMLQKGMTGKLNKKQAELIDQIHRGNERLLTLVKDLLNLSKLQEGKFEVEAKKIDLTQSIKDAVDTFMNLAKRKSIELKLEKPATRLPQVWADENRITQVLTNIISNAVKYTPDKGQVTVNAEVKTGAELAKLGKATSTADIQFTKNKSGYVVISCQDTGIGISKENQKKMFSRFFRATNVLQSDIEGTGLGMYITKSIVNLHHGDIWFTSVEGQGSTFYFSVPIATK